MDCDNNISEWVHFKKYFRGGSSEHFELIPFKEGSSLKEKKKRTDEIGQDWSEQTSGGHCDGYTFEITFVNKPSIKWLNEKISKLKGG